MRTLMLTAMLTLAAPVMVFTTGGCGGGGTTAPGGSVIVANPNESFLGGYFWQLWSGNVAGPTCTSQWGIITADGTGIINAGVVAQNQGGVLSGLVPIPALPYSVTANGQIDITVGLGTLSGGITEDGSLLAVTQTTAGLDPALAIVPRGQGVFNNASLSGEYHLCALWFDGAGVTEISNWGTVTFDGVGAAFDYSAGINVNGAIFPPGVPLGWGVYAVDPTGYVTWAHPIAAMAGGIAFGGDIVVLSGTTMATDRQRIAILIKKGAGLSNATFAGSYHTVTIEASNAPPPRYETRVSVSVVDGAGLLTFGDATVNTDGVISQSPGGGAVAYSVDPDGALDIIGGILQGGVSASGRVAMFAGNTGGGNPQIWFMFR